MTDKEKIRQEIERRREKYRISRDFIDAIRCTTCTEILSFIDSLPEEKKPIREYVSPEDSTLGKLYKEAMEELEEKIALYKKNHSASVTYEAEVGNGAIKALVTKELSLISEDLKQAIHNAIFALDERKGYTFKLEDMFMAGAKWQKEQTIEWLEENLAKETSVIGNGNVTIKFRGAIEAFKKAMEEYL